MNKNKYFKGYTLVEMLVVVLVFSILGLVITKVVTTTLRNSGKSENIVVVKENVNYALGVMERNIRNAEEILSTSTSTRINYINSEGSTEYFRCVNASGVNRIRTSELGGGYLTNNNVSVTCSGMFTYSPSPISYVDITIDAMDAKSATNGISALTANYSESISVKLRNN